MATQTESLQAAERLLSASKREEALGKLLIAWRAVRHPRIANVIDFVSSEIVASLPPIRGKTAAARMTAWHAIEKLRDPATLGQLLSAPWPGTWKPALAMLEPLLAWPHDPRMAMAFARIVDETPYVTWTSDRFYRPLVDKLVEISDLRTLSLLRAQLAKRKPYYVARDLRPMEEAAIAALENAYPNGESPKLAAATEQALAALEARYADRITDAKSRAAGEQEHLAAILANPDDVAARAVYADWLGERGDPRGEFITLQLARSAAPASSPPSFEAMRRERQLLAEHGAAWAGAMASWFDKDEIEFEDGFFAGGTLRDAHRLGRGVGLDEILADPAWALVRTIGSSWEHERLLAMARRPELRSLRAVRGLDRASAEALAAGDRLGLRSLGWYEGASEPIEKSSPLSTCAALPALRELRIDATGSIAPWIRTAPVIERIERIVLTDLATVEKILEAAASRAGALREIELPPYGRYRREPDAGWRVIVVRDKASGPFTRLVARPRGGPHDPAQLALAFTSIPKGWLTDVDVAISKKRLVLPKATRDRLAQALKRLATTARVSVPWDTASPPPAKPKRSAKAAAGTTLSLHLEGESLLDPKKIDKVWKLFVEDLEQPYDSFEVGYGSAFRSLGDDPLARVQTWANNQKAERIELHVDGQRHRLGLSRIRHDDTASTSGTIVLGDKTPAAVVDAFVKLLEIGKLASGWVRDALDEKFDFDAFDLGDFAPSIGNSGGWLVVFGGKARELLPTSRVAKLSSKPGLRGLFVREAKHGMLIGLAATPQEATKQRLATASAALREIMATELPGMLGFDLTARARAVLGPVAKELGLAYDKQQSSPTTIRFVNGKQLQRRLVVELSELYAAAPVIEIELHKDIRGGGWRPHDLVDGRQTVRTVAQLDKLLAIAAKRARADGATFLDAK